MRDDQISAFLFGFIVGFIIVLFFNAFMNVNHSSNTELLCGVLSDNNISNSTVVMLCSEKK